jgi:GntR family transcriptional regulator/MocR family aminotransferase
MLWFTIDRSKTTPLTKQICEQLRLKILTRELSVGERLPPTRKLAQELGISRNVIINVYEQLVSEGYLESREGSGTYVAEGTYLEQYKATFADAVDWTFRRAIIPRDQQIIAFQSGVPDLELFPRNIWAKLLREVCLDASESLFDYTPVEGLPEIRYALAKFLLRAKGIRCHPDQIIIVSGSAEGLALLFQVVARTVKRVILEEPLYNGIHRIVDHLGYECVPVAVDEKGIRVEDIPHNIQAGAVLVTPSHHYPSGCILSIQRRIKLVEYARRTNTLIIENDYDSEFRYSGSPISSIHLLDPEQVAHVGTFSESLYPSVRLGYLVLPEHIVEACRNFKASLGLVTASLQQLALSRFLEEGYLERHIGKMKKVYQKRRKCLLAGLHDAFGRQLVIRGDATGLYVVAEFQHYQFIPEVLEQIARHNVRVSCVEEHTLIKGKHANQLILGFGNLTHDRIEEGIRRLKAALA